MVLSKKILIIEPFGKLSGHHSNFAKNIIDISSHYKKNIDLLTFDGLSEHPISKIRHFQILDLFPPIIRSFIKLLIMGNKSKMRNKKIYSLLSLIYSLILHRLFRYSCVYFLDGNISFSLLASFFVPTGIEIHNAAFIPTGNFKKPLFARAYRKIFFKLSASKKTLFFASSNINHNLSKWFIRNANIAVVPWGIGTSSDFQLSSRVLENHTTVKLILFGVNHYSKDYEIIFSALSEFSKRKEKKQFSLVIAGPLIPSEKNDPYILQQKFNLPNLTIVDKYLEEDEIKQLFLESDYLILAYVPSFKGTSSIIDFAMMYNIPIITSDSGDLYQRVKAEQIGLVFNAGDVTDLINTLDQSPHPNSEEYIQFQTKLEDIYLRELNNRSWLESVRLRLEKLDKFCSSQ